MSNLTVKELGVSSPYLNDVYYLYKERFGQAWGEVSRCSDGFSPLPVGSLCTNCNQIRTDAYPPEETHEYISSELSQPGTVAVLGLLDQLVSFAWGYQSTPQEIVKKKWQDYPESQQQIVDSLKPYIGQYASMFYISECVTRKGFEKMGYQRQLVEYLSRNKDSQLPLLVRTLVQSSMARICTGFLNLTLVREYVDPERSDRVLFVSPKN